MYLHVGYNVVVSLDKLIGIFDSDAVWSSREVGFVPEEKRKEFVLHKSIILMNDGSVEYSDIKVKYLLNRFSKNMREIKNGRKRIHR